MQKPQHILTNDDVRKVAQLARIEINEADMPKHINTLNNILALIEQMNSIDTTKTVPMYSSLDATLTLRDDTVTETNQRDVLQKLTASVLSGLYLVPQVIE